MSSITDFFRKISAFFSNIFNAIRSFPEIMEKLSSVLTRGII